MAKFMLLLKESPMRPGDLSPEEIQGIIEEYVAWRRGLEEAGRFLGGAKLKDEGGKRMSRSGDAVRVLDGPYAEAKEVIGGYFLVEAADYPEAVALGESCPHLAFGGTIELREIDPAGD